MSRNRLLKISAVHRLPALPTSVGSPAIFQVNRHESGPVGGLGRLAEPPEQRNVGAGEVEGEADAFLPEEEVLVGLNRPEHADVASRPHAERVAVTST